MKHYESLVRLEADTLKEAEIKEQFKKEYFWINRMLLKIKLESRNLIKSINTWTIPP